LARSNWIAKAVEFCGKAKRPTQKNNPVSGGGAKGSEDTSHGRVGATAGYFSETRREKWLAGNGRIGYKIVQGRTASAADTKAEKRRESVREAG